MKIFKPMFPLCTSLALLLGSAPLAVAQAVLNNVSASGEIRTTNCSGAGGLCRPTPDCNGGAGPNQDNIQASVTLCEFNGTLYGSGRGTGFRPGKTYISLIYQNGNTATCSRFPAGVDATLPNLAQGDSDFASMMLGFWVVKADGSATLTVAKQATVLGLQKYGSVSVREMQAPDPCYVPMNDPAPQFNALRACGALTIGGACGPDPCNALPDLCDIDFCRRNPELCN